MGLFTIVTGNDVYKYIYYTWPWQRATARGQVSIFLLHGLLLTTMAAGAILLLTTTLEWKDCMTLFYTRNAIVASLYLFYLVRLGI